MFKNLFFSLSSTSSMMLWVCLEMNLLSFLPLMVTKNFFALEGAMKYFLVQSSTSAFFIMSILLSYYSFSPSSDWILLATMLVKLGCAPAHGWMLSIMKMTDPWMLLYLSTLQKLIPMVILNSLEVWKPALGTLILFNVLAIYSSGKSSVSINSILAFSSVNSLSWLLASSWGGLKTMLTFFSIYLILLIGVILMCSAPLKSTFRQTHSMSLTEKIFLVLALMSLAGVPPFLGFIGKVLVLKVSFYSMGASSLLMMYGSLMILYYYLSYSYISMAFPPNLAITQKSAKLSISKSFYLSGLFLVCTTNMLMFKKEFLK